MLTDGEAYEVTKVLKENVQGGTGTAANYGCPAAGKTGTTDEAKDAWFVGYTPKLSAAVWVGYPDAGVAMPGAQGGTYAAPVWHDFMLPAHGDYCDDFPEPTEPASFSPFFGKYSRTGSARDRRVLRPLRARHARPEVRPALLRGRAARRAANRDASRPIRPARGTRSWERERERQWERQREWRGRHRRSRLISPCGRARPDRSYRGHAHRPQRTAGPLDR